MRVEFEFYATTRDAAGTDRLVREVPEGETVEAALVDLAAERSALESLLFRTDGSLRTHLNVLVDGQNVRNLDGTETTLDDGATVAVLPAVSGG